MGYDKRSLSFIGGLGGLSSSSESPAISPDESTSPATFILGTSYFASPRLGTVANSGPQRAGLRLNRDGRVPGEDRKGPFDHLSPKSLVMSTVRLTAINISTTLSTFFSEQLKLEQTNESKVDSEEITPCEADEMNEEWERREWELRTKALPRKIGWAVLRFHACTALMRFYEIVIARVLQVDCGSFGASALPKRNDVYVAPKLVAGEGTRFSALTHAQAITILDKLTRDTFRASLRTSQLLYDRECSPGKVISSDGTETSTSRELTKTMFSTCLWANIIPFFAELTMQQLVLAYGYGVNYIAREKRNKERKSRCQKYDDNISEQAYVLSLMFRSSRLTIARSMSWIVASAGGAVGSVVYPGWGTVFGVQIGDTVIGALID